MIPPQVRVGSTHLDDTAPTEVARHEIAGLPGVTADDADLTIDPMESTRR